jgi:hypothetical protein
MSNFIFNFYHSVDGAPLRTLVGAAGEDIKDALVAAARKAVASVGKPPDGILGVIHTEEEVADLSDLELKKIADKSILHTLGFNITPELSERIYAPAEEKKAAVATTPATDKPQTPVAPKARKARGNAANPKPADENSVIEDDPEKDSGKSQYSTLIQSVVNKYLGQPVNADTAKNLVTDLTNILVNNCTGIENLKIALEGELVKVTSSFGDFSVAVV